MTIRGRFVLAIVAAGILAGAAVYADGTSIGQNKATGVQATTTELAGGAPVPFTSNGCSGFREARFFSCCFVHDFAFWAGGNWTDRRNADKDLWRCVIDVSGERLLADISYFLLRLGIGPGMVVNDGWGRAWTGTERRRFSDLTVEQRQVVSAERKRICQSLTPIPDTLDYTIDSRYLAHERRELRGRQARLFCGDELDRPR